MLSFGKGDAWAWRAQVQAAVTSLGVSLEEFFEHGEAWAAKNGIVVASNAYGTYRQSLEKPKKGEKQEPIIEEHMRRYVAHINGLKVAEDNGVITPFPSEARIRKDLSPVASATIVASQERPRYVRQMAFRR